MRGDGWSYWGPWRIERLRFEIGWSYMNYHNHRKAIAAGWATDVACETIYGWHVRSVKLSRGRRFMLYMPSGAWWHIDIQVEQRSL